MNAKPFMSRLVAVAAACLVSFVAPAAELVIAANPKLVDKSLIADFEKQSNVHVTLAAFTGQTGIESELLSKKATFDLALTDLGFVAGNYSSQIFREFGASIDGMDRVDAQIQSAIERHTVGHNFAIPQTYGIRALGFSKSSVEARLGKYVPTTWAEILSPRAIAALADCGIALSSDRNVTVPTVLVAMGSRASTTDADAYHSAVRRLKQIVPYVHGANSETAAISLSQGQVCLAALDGADLYRITATNNNKLNVNPVVPKAGGELIIDTWVMPTTSNKSKEATAFVSFLLDPANQAKLSNSIIRASVVPESWTQVREELRVSPIIYPSAEVRAAYYVWVRNITTLRLIDRSWDDLNVGGNRIFASRR